MTTLTSSLDLPQSVLDLVEFSPAEDVLLAILRDGLPDVPIKSQIEDNPPPIFVLVRRVNAMGDWAGDPRFIDFARFQVETFTPDPNGDQKGALLSEAVRVVLRDAGMARKVVPGKGSVCKIEMVSEPTRKTDWATASGPVQYADLPNGTWRYESYYNIEVRKPL